MMNIYSLLAYTSPFKTFDEFSAAKGPIYTFAHVPGLIGFLLVVCALMSLYFVYATFMIKAGTSEAKSPMMLSILLALGMVSVADRIYTNHIKGSDRPTASEVRDAGKSNTAPFALLGLLGGGTAATRLKRRSARRRVR